MKAKKRSSKTKSCGLNKEIGLSVTIAKVVLRPQSGIGDVSLSLTGVRIQELTTNTNDGDFIILVVGKGVVDCDLVTVVQGHWLVLWEVDDVVVNEVSHLVGKLILIDVLTISIITRVRKIDLTWDGLT
ncbi:hypothetical protein WICPIJ_006356 [Wickerhamomyces pijperi]|uniref:Uncharacterized protein n=1 Tax=Wickerhamomyces pijperi TaxID=599730 RepID=A0A9P8Q1V4_WICPI|nr:hypothetical protein WICPIJ_006356 [Wickerhamomyces pijperi]